MTAPLKMLTLHQPWASLIAVGAKSIETRSWSTRYRGPIAIHAGLSPAAMKDIRRGAKGYRPAMIAFENRLDRLFRWSGWEWADTYGRLPLGAVVAVADLVDVVPMVHCGEEGAVRTLDIDDNGSLWIVEPREFPELSLQDDPEKFNAYVNDMRHDGAEVRPETWEDWCEANGHVEDPGQREVSDQRPFGDFTPGRYAWLLDNVRPIDPIPAKGHQGLRDVPADMRAALGVPS